MPRDATALVSGRSVNPKTSIHQYLKRLQQFAVVTKLYFHQRFALHDAAKRATHLYSFFDVVFDVVNFLLFLPLKEQRHRVTFQARSFTVHDIRGRKPPGRLQQIEGVGALHSHLSPFEFTVVQNFILLTFSL